MDLGQPHRAPVSSTARVPGKPRSAAVQDVILHSEVTADGDWWSATVYFHEPSL